MNKDDSHETKVPNSMPEEVVKRHPFDPNQLTAALDKAKKANQDQEDNPRSKIMEAMASRNDEDRAIAAGVETE